MAGFNAILAARFNRFLQKFLSMKGGPPAASLAGEWMPVFNFPIDEADLRMHLGWERFGVVGISGAGGAGNFNKHHLRNPVGSKVMAIVEAVIVSNIAGNPQVDLRVGTGLVDFPIGLGTTNSALDRRGRTSPTCTWTAASDSSLTTAVQIYPTINFAVNEHFNFITQKNLEIPVPPGQSLIALNNVPNLGFSCGMIFRERIMEESELA